LTSKYLLLQLAPDPRLEEYAIIFYHATDVHYSFPLSPSAFPPLHMRFGAHVSIAGGLAEAADRAADVGCDTMQIFAGSPRTWKPGQFAPDDIAKFKQRRSRLDIRPVTIHLPYLVNLGSPIERVVSASLGSLKDTLIKARSIGADFLVVHTGSHGGAGRARGIAAVVKSLKALLESDFGSARLLLENTAGTGHTFGDRIEDIAEIIARVDADPRVGLCLDTCHAYAAGYDLASPEELDRFMAELDAQLGLDRLGLVHANDCKGDLGGRRDRHEHIGRGSIGLAGFRNILAHPTLKEMSFVIETPRPDPDDDRRNLAVLRSLAPRK
jgi:deoxyribonuclease IV